MKSKITIEGLAGAQSLGMVIDLLYTLRHAALRDWNADLHSAVTFDLEQLCKEMFHHTPSNMERKLVLGLCHSLNLRISREDSKCVIGDNVASLSEIVTYRNSDDDSATEVTMLLGHILTTEHSVDEMLDDAKMYLESAFGR